VKPAASFAFGGRRLELDTLFLDAGGVLVNPDWVRVSEALGRHGVAASAQALSAAEPFAKRQLDTATAVPATNDAARGWLYFDLVLAQAGIPRSDGTEAALAELRAYHSRFNLWQSVPEDVRPSLARFRAAGLRLVVVSNANGTLHGLFDRLGLAQFFDHLFDSHLEKVEKPDPRFFTLALERSGGRTMRTVHVGDLYHVDVAGARSAGLEAVLLDAGGLYPEADCPRVPSLGALADALRAGAD
jgi:HAD superfamily hydrolase (TIGR01509 family)